MYNTIQYNTTQQKRNLSLSSRLLQYNTIQYNTMTDECAICLESLVSEEQIGVSNPCGHPFHVHCFEEWKQHSDDLKRICKCPTCNKKTKTFLPIFINFDPLLADNPKATAEEKQEIITQSISKLLVEGKQTDKLRKHLKAQKAEKVQLKKKLKKYNQLRKELKSQKEKTAALQKKLKETEQRLKGVREPKELSREPIKKKKKRNRNKSVKNRMARSPQQRQRSNNLITASSCDTCGKNQCESWICTIRRRLPSSLQ